MYKNLIAALLCATFFLGMVSVHAADVDTASEPAAATVKSVDTTQIPPQQPPPTPSLWQVIKIGGFIMLLLFIIFVIMLCFIVYCVLKLVQAKLMPARFTRRLDEIVSKRRFDEAVMFCRQHNNPLARIVEAGIEAAPRGREVVAETMNSEGVRQASRLWQKISYFNDLSILAPMLGLLGTVIGMLNAFLAVAARGGTVIGNINPAALTNGVAKAMITTVAGLIIGIIATVAYTYFRGVVQRMVVMLEVGADRFAANIEQGAKKSS